MPGEFYVFNAMENVELATDVDDLDERLKAKSEAMLRREATYLEKQPHRTDAELQAAAFAIMELERRATEDAHSRTVQLAKKTTWITALSSVIAALLGVVVGFWLNSGGTP